MTDGSNTNNNFANPRFTLSRANDINSHGHVRKSIKLVFGLQFSLNLIRHNYA